MVLTERKRAPASSRSAAIRWGEARERELAGHMDLATTQRYMHLSPAAIEGAIRLLDQPGPAKAGHYVRSEPVHGFGDILETADREIGNSLP